MSYIDLSIPGTVSKIATIFIWKCCLQDMSQDQYMESVKNLDFIGWLAP